ncbi:MAG: Beta-lactamase class A-like protein [Candidatus Gottesmanbacteria bacterium GW2011_GWC2_42_8]|nr:MAG: Beta-lactamase class A-like protein [Candidatus Gottesmanbacteria bacterium GW2011_GWC2_42_8]
METGYPAFDRNIESKTGGGSRKAYLGLAVFLILITLTVLYKAEKVVLLNPVVEVSPKISENKAGDKPNQVTVADNLDFEEIEAEISRLTSDSSGTYSVYLEDLNSGRNFGINEQMVVTAASVNKIPILAALYHKAGKNEIDLDRIIVPQAKDVQDYGTGSIRYDAPGTAYSLKTLARLMMEKSDNTAAYILASLVVGLDDIQNLIESWGLTQTDMKINKTSAKDIAIITLTAEMIDFMDDSDFEDRIPKGIDGNTKVYHKTGDEVRTVHDAGIVDLPGKPYFLAVFTTDIVDEEATKTKIAQISRIVYENMK